MRIDKWLWAVRVFKTRQQAADACRLQRVTIAGAEVKPSREVRAGDVIQINRDGLMRTVRVTGILAQRVGAKLVPDYMEDLTPPEVYEAARERRRQEALSPPVAPECKPTGRAREMLRKIYGGGEND